MNDRSRILYIVCVALALAAGIFMRVHPTEAAYRLVGSDEGTYAGYLTEINMVGIGNYHRVVKTYEDDQAKISFAVVHPLRMTYLLSSYGWMRLFYHPPANGSAEVMGDALLSLHAVSALFSVLMLLLAGVIAWRFGGKWAVPGVLALVALAPLQVCLAQRALVDGVYAFFAVLSFWLLWENLRAPKHKGWLAAYFVSLFVLVLTKEYAAFVVFAFCVIMALNWWLDFGKVTPALLTATVAGPALAVMLLMYYAGGVMTFFHFYLNFVNKSRTLDYAIYEQDGPWSRYLLDFLIISPAVLLLAVGRVLQLDRNNKVDGYCATFWIFSYLPMMSVTYGMSLRFAALWDFPMCWLAWSLLRTLSERFAPRHAAAALAVAVVLVCGVELREYSRIFVEFKEPHPVYDPITRNLLEAARIIKYDAPAAAQPH